MTGQKYKFQKPIIKLSTYQTVHRVISGKGSRRGEYMFSLHTYACLNSYIGLCNFPNLKELITYLQCKKEIVL
jgi:hypothetical protein